jgi:hypothetical protein
MLNLLKAAISFPEIERFGSQKEPSMPPVLRSLVTESDDLVRSSAKMTIMTILLGLAIILVSWTFTAGLPLLAMTIYGR